MDITSNGSYLFDVSPGRSYAVFIAGSMGGGSGTIYVKDSVADQSVEMPDYGNLAAGMTFQFVAPVDKLLIVLADATDPALTVTVQLLPV